jgi:hypothetical protein
MGPNHTYQHEHRAKRPPDVDLQFRMEFILDRPASERRGKIHGPRHFGNTPASPGFSAATAVFSSPSAFLQYDR